MTRVPFWRRVALPLALVFALAAPGRGAMAHAVLLETQPVDAVRLDTAPAEVRLRFNEPVRAVSVRLIGDDGRPVEAAAETRQALLVLTPHRPLPRGGYMVVYRVMSGDGHPVAGTIAFGVSAPPPAGDEPPAPDAVLLGLLGMLARAFHYGGLLLAAGGTLFLCLAGGMNRQLGGAVAPAAGAAVAGALAGAGIAGTAAAGLPVSALFEGAVWWTGLAGSAGSSALALAVGLAVALSGVRRGRRVPALAGALCALASPALTGHAVFAPPRALALPAVMVHLTAAAWWIGSLPPLRTACRTGVGGAALVALVRRFSRLALVAVPVLIAAGALLSLLQIRSVAGLGTVYGVVWLAKMAGVAGLLALAALNKLRLTPALERTGDPAPLARSILAEMALAVLVVAATAGLGSTPPPRAVAGLIEAEPPGAAAIGYAAQSTTAAGTALVELEPARPGPNILRISLTGPDGEPLAAGAGRLVLRRNGGAEPMEPDIATGLDATGPGSYRPVEVILPGPGTWTVSIKTPGLAVRVSLPVPEDKK